MIDAFLIAHPWYVMAVGAAIIYGLNRLGRHVDRQCDELARTKRQDFIWRLEGKHHKAIWGDHWDE